MTHRYLDLAQRKQLLRLHSGLLRHQLLVDWQVAVAPVTRVAEHAREGVLWLRAHPALVVGVGVALLLWRPAGMMNLAGRGVWLWQIWQRVKPALARLGTPPSNR